MAPMSSPTTRTSPAGPLRAAQRRHRRGGRGSAIRIRRCGDPGGGRTGGTGGPPRRVRVFPLGPGFLVDGRPVILTAPRPAPARRPAAHRVRVGQGATPEPEWRWPAASTSRGATTPNSSSRSGVTIFGSKVWWWSTWAGSTISPTIVTEFGPGPRRRLGVLVDHLVTGSKRPVSPRPCAAARAASTAWWSGTPTSTSGRRSSRRGSDWPAWPTVPRGVEWKNGICQALGWPHRTQADIARAWQRIRGSVRDWTDLEPELIGRVEELIDFVTQDD